MYKKSIAGLFVGVLAFGLLSFKTESERYFEIAKNLDVFATLFKEVNTYYVDDVPPAKMMRTGIDAMLKSLDPYTNYIPEDDIEDFRTMTTGQYGGIGAVIGSREGKVVVQMPYENSPAHKAGLAIGDEILKINGVTVTGKSTSDVSKLLKGQANTSVKLEVRSYGQTKSRTVELLRDNIMVENVPYYGMLDNEIGYFQLSGFTVDASKEVKMAVQKLKEMGAKKIVFDLRDNPGGLLHEAVNISNVFVDKGQDIVSTKGKVKEWNKTYKALDEPLDKNIPLVILTSSRSASASEIVAGVMQDYDRAVLVGERTFGKGLVQVTRPLSYNSQLKVTTAKYYIPSGRCIQAIDYTHRNEDGSVGKVPDSLRVAFKTAAGRTVYDGGGVAPDVEVKQQEYSDITKTIAAKGYFFDYANKYKFEHPTIPAAKEFNLTDEEYKSFVSYLSGKDVSYATNIESELDELAAEAKEGKHYDDIRAELEAIRNKVSHNKANDLMRFKSEIMEVLEAEIASRYYLQKGYIEATFDDDPDILMAKQVLNNPEKYSSYLKLN
ncbi:S41A family C-terminal processing peptidase-3 [Pontibacter ummariensis]|uniref:C-terminal processing peptidase-3. Serine peptidase. MEROPS family S41A n=1 Tax=Pontibacter ummariensis TaxID=1610492 RepID=A0A239JMC4_9BACT|nr:S41 family peptidase [Pontibacter ummariensis]PRY07891.1 S41A family C-terminal processing peptidase-3 [Pontibacter ummariensis]SNT06985.1 C-terminal processing peptidase-3. Serine peptidase. MEROPS family S41A [Pontibacter ummariensis]